MTRAEATAEVFWTAFKALPKKERDIVLARLTSDRILRKDLIDIAIAMERMDEPTRSLNEVLQEIRGHKKRKS